VQDSNGASDLRSVILWITPAFGSSVANTCQVFLDTVTNQVSLLNDAGTRITGSPGSLANSQCFVEQSATSGSLT
jgi:hypothetical protein